jgi:hypothetical protein
VAEGHIFTSSDYGVTWRRDSSDASLSTRRWQAVAYSGDGSSVFAAVFGGSMYTNINFPTCANGLLKTDVCSSTPDANVFVIVGIFGALFICLCSCLCKDCYSDIRSCCCSPKDPPKPQLHWSRAEGPHVVEEREVVVERQEQPQERPQENAYAQNQYSNKQKQQQQEEAPPIIPVFNPFRGVQEAQQTQYATSVGGGYASSAGGGGGYASASAAPVQVAYAVPAVGADPGLQFGRTVHTAKRAGGGGGQGYGDRRL